MVLVGEDVAFGVDDEGGRRLIKVQELAPLFDDVLQDRRNEDLSVFRHDPVGELLGHDLGQIQAVIDRRLPDPDRRDEGDDEEPDDEGDEVAGRPVAEERLAARLFSFREH